MKSSLFLVAIISIALSVGRSFAGSATWATNARSNDWNTALNWTPQTIPNGPEDVATFASSRTTGVSVATAIDVNSIIFGTAASAFTVTVQPTDILTITGGGVTNNSGVTQNFSAAPGGYYTSDFGSIIFDGRATAGEQNVYTTKASPYYGSAAGYLAFYSDSTAGSATFIGEGGEASGAFEFYGSSTAADAVFTLRSGNFQGAQVRFYDTSTAGRATLNGLGGGEAGGAIFFSDSSNAGTATVTVSGPPDSGTVGSEVEFFDSSTAGNSTLLINGGDGSYGVGVGAFWGSSTAANSTIICNGGPDYVEGGVVEFYQFATGGTARIELIGVGKLILSGYDRDFPQVSIGSVEGDGFVDLEGSELVVGSNNLDTTFSGIISDGDIYFGSGGSLTKVGDGQLTLTNANDYPGGTTVDSGILMVNNTGASGTGTGPLQVNNATLAGTGIIRGPVTIGTGGFYRIPTLAPGNRGPGLLVIQNTLTFKSDATFNCKLRIRNGEASGVWANGVTVEHGAISLVSQVGHGALPLGTTFTLINNTATTAIAGQFKNLHDGAVLDRGDNRYQVNYEGGDGNDLTLTVVP